MPCGPHVLVRACGEVDGIVTTPQSLSAEGPQGPGLQRAGSEGAPAAPHPQRARVWRKGGGSEVHLLQDDHLQSVLPAYRAGRAGAPGLRTGWSSASRAARGGCSVPAASSLVWGEGPYRPSEKQERRPPPSGPGRVRVKGMAKRPPEEERREEAAAAPTGHLSAALHPRCARGVFRRSLHVAPTKADPRNARCNRGSHLGFCVVVPDPWVKHCQPGVCSEFPSPTLPVYPLETGSQVSFSGKSAHPAPSRGRRCLHFHSAPPHTPTQHVAALPHSPQTLLHQIP